MGVGEVLEVFLAKDLRQASEVERTERTEVEGDKFIIFVL